MKTIKNILRTYVLVEYQRYDGTKVFTNLGLDDGEKGYLNNGNLGYSLNNNSITIANMFQCK